ncbi:ABC transporter ATP-binding protein [Sulfuriferula nivalis]|uniref:ABC transporter ATP-binding protein n=1 Tax=Sulfuriferula nivalis TaxID=2675298 RepID=A0A809S6Y2_9PROT|nr:ATP-binding cassette domain-containing protein [Sulfuriferula nivalis]BBO99392.1 ABC transporter ATP-binding protein [Sulfuriferula nivalis]
MSDDTLIAVENIVTRFGVNTIHDGVSMSVRRGEVVALIGGSGTGKSVLLKEMIGLLRPTAGQVQLFGESVWTSSEAELRSLRQRFGVLFQDGALFSSINVARNVATPLFEHTDLAQADCLQLAQLKLALAGLSPDAATKMPNELSGGMRKRVALARALALDPELLFLDEPTSGLDPISARAFDHLIRTLADNLGLTVLLVTHDLDTLLSIIDRVIVLSNGKVLGSGTVAEIKQIDDDWLQAYFAARANTEDGNGK